MPEAITPRWAIDRALLAEKFPIDMPGGPWLGELFKTRSRATGRRIIVRNPDKPEELWFDSDECYDLGNAINRLDNWLAEELKKFQPAKLRDISDPSITPTLAEALADPAGFVAGMEEAALTREQMEAVADRR